MASRLFGDPEAAVGKRIDLATFKWRLGVDDKATFEVVGVVATRFHGTDIERPVDAWLGINGWASVLYPEQQIEDVRQSFGASTLAAVTDSPAAFARTLKNEIQALGYSVAGISLTPGAGYHPERRARFLAISDSLLLGLFAVTGLLIAAALSFGFIRNLRAATSDYIRMTLGEDRKSHILRKLHTAWPPVFLTAAGAGVLLFFMSSVDSLGLPLDAAIARGMSEPSVRIGVWLFILVFFSAPFWPAGRQSASDLTSARPTRSFTILLVLILVFTAAVSLVGSISAQRAVALLNPGLTTQMLDTVVSDLDPSGRGWVFSRRSVAALERDLAEINVAIATSGPVGTGVVGERASLSVGPSEQPIVLHINRVSANYFSTIGLALRGECGSLESLRNDHVIANRSFLSVYGILENYDDVRIRLGDRTLRICGVVDDAYVADARAGLAPVVYAPLSERRHARVLVAAEAPILASGRADPVLEEHFPSLAADRATSSRARLMEQLWQERQIIWLNVAIVAIAVLVALTTTWILVQVVINSTLRHLAVRRALGSSLKSLALIALFGTSQNLRRALLTGASVAVAVVSWIAADDLNELAVPLLVATAVTGSIIVATAVRIPRVLHDAHLWESLKTD